MSKLTETQANVEPRDNAEAQLGTVRTEDQSLESKLITFTLGLTTAQFEWLRQLRLVDWQIEDPKNKTWHLFAEAKLCGIRHSVAYPLVKHVVEPGRLTIVCPSRWSF